MTTAPKPSASPEAVNAVVIAGAATCSASTHDFKEEYYGWRCSKCGCFYPNTAPLGAWLNGETYDGQDS